MSDMETRALGRAALLLLVAGVVRLGLDAAGSDSPGSPEEVSPGLLEDSRSMARSEEVRRRPLEAQEKLDPNLASEEALDRLPGVGAATARAIVRSREVEGAFQGPDDLSRVKGIGPVLVRRMAPHLDFSRSPRSARSLPPAPPPRPAPVDLNRAPPAALEALPGIGPALARRIVAARSQRLFSSVEDLERVPGIGPATLARIRPFVVAKR